MKSQVLQQFKRFLKDEEGATAVEYGVMVALIIAVCIGIIYTVGQSVKGGFSDVDTALASPATAPK